MKKTLAAVLAAAMALSTASVAFATDTLVEVDLGSASTTSTEDGVEYGKDTKRIIESLGDFGAAELAQLVDDGKISVSAIVTEGSSKLASKPTVSIVTTSDTNGDQINGEDVYTWAETFTFNGLTVKEGSVVTNIPVAKNAAGNWVFAGNPNAVNPDETAVWMEPTHARYDDLLETLTDNDRFVVTATMDHEVIPGNDALQLKFKVAHTYGTDETTVKMKLRITVRKDFIANDGTSYDKGDTYTSDEITFKAEYHELTSYSEDMELTLTEVDENYVKLDASDLYDEIGADNFVIYFDDSAAFSAKLSSAQKDVNLYYSVEEIDDIVEHYPDVDFEFISFYGAPSFNNAGKMTFNAIGGKDTQVYVFDGETLTPYDREYDSTYGVVTVDGIKKLTTFVVADQVLEVEEEEEEPEEPADETPAVEEKNPSTGAC